MRQVSLVRFVPTHLRYTYHVVVCARGLAIGTLGEFLLTACVVSFPYLLFTMSSPFFHPIYPFLSLSLFLRISMHYVTLFLLYSVLFTCLCQYTNTHVHKHIVHTHTHLSRSPFHLVSSLTCSIYAPRIFCFRSTLLSFKAAV